MLCLTFFKDFLFKKIIFLSALLFLSNIFCRTFYLSDIVHRTFFVEDFTRRISYLSDIFVGQFCLPWCFCRTFASLFSFPLSVKLVILAGCFLFFLFLASQFVALFHFFSFLSLLSVSYFFLSFISVTSFCLFVSCYSLDFPFYPFISSI